MCAVGVVQTNLKIVRGQIIDFFFFLVVAKLVAENAKLLKAVHHTYTELIYGHIDFLADLQAPFGELEHQVGQG